MTGTTCSVVTCKSNALKAKKSGERVHFFRFPKDPEIQLEWIRKCARKDKWNPLYKRICSKHFESDAYEDEMQAKIMNTQPKKLRIDAVPTLLLPNLTEERASDHNPKMLKKDRKAAVEELLLDSIESLTLKILECQQETMNISEIPSTSLGNDCELGDRKWEDVERENVALRKHIEDLDKKNCDLKTEILELNEHIKEYRLQFELKGKKWSV